MDHIPDLLPARMLNESVFCERLFYFMWVSQLFEGNRHTAAGSEIHERVDTPRRDGPEEQPRAVTALTLTSEKLGVVAKLDLVEFDGKRAVPIDYKVGKPAPVEGGVWPPERVQACVQALLLREAGYECSETAIWFHATRRRVDVTITEALIAETMTAVWRAKQIAAEDQPPPPLLDSPKCATCVVVGLCLPYETNLLAGREPRQQPRLMVPDWTGRPLYVSEPGTRIGVSGNNVAVRPREGDPTSIRIIDIDQVCVFGRGVQVSTSALHSFMSHNIPVLYFSGGGWFSGIAHGLPGKDVELRRRQVVTASTDGLRYARSFVAGKIRNSRTLLRRHASSDSSKETLRSLASLADRAERADDTQSLLGIEGLAAKHYFSQFNGMIEPPMQDFFRFEGRSRRPPRDPVNAVMSFLYGLVVKELTVAAMAVGLDPYLGFFHRPRFGRPALALDLAEEFRSIVADSTVLMLINNGELRPAHFIGHGSSTGLTQDGRRRVIKAFERRLDVETTHPLFGYRVTYRRLLHLQVRVLARSLFGEIPEYVPFVTR